MQITQIKIYKSPIKLKESFIISLGRLDYAENIIVIIKTNQGITGFGECCPFKTINGESMDSGFIVGQYLAKGLLGKDPLNTEACSQIMDTIIYGNSSIKSAFDIALHDIAAQHASLPLYKYLGGKKPKTIITDYTISIDEPEKMAKDALAIKSKGFQIIKVKLGGSKEKDVERIRKIRETIGIETAIRIDANQGWDLPTAIATLKELHQYQIQFCEEPIPRWSFMELPKLKQQSPIPIMADESCSDHHDAERLVKLGACDMINIKLGKSSGIFKAQKIIKLAETANIPLQIGGFLESRLEVTACAHLALTSEYVQYFDFDTPLMFEEDPVINGISYDNKGVVTVPDLPGLGASFDETYLKKLSSIIIK
jgi:L-Ala-D/L-Glu epimerase